MRFYSYNADMQIVLVLPKDQQEYWLSLCNQHQFHLEYTLADGGETRFHSVKNGIAKVREDVEVIGIHDGVRPFVTNEVISLCYDTAATSDAAIPVIDVYETLRHLIIPENNHDTAQKSSSSVTVPRAEYKLVQTPQVFSAHVLRTAYSQPYTENSQTMHLL